MNKKEIQIDFVAWLLLMDRLKNEQNNPLGRIKGGKNETE